jgi:hypothetical protein
MGERRVMKIAESNMDLMEMFVSLSENKTFTTRKMLNFFILTKS